MRTPAVGLLMASVIGLPPPAPAKNDYPSRFGECSLLGPMACRLAANPTTVGSVHSEPERSEVMAQHVTGVARSEPARTPV